MTIPIEAVARAHYESKRGLLPDHPMPPWEDLSDAERAEEMRGARFHARWPSRGILNVVATHLTERMRARCADVLTAHVDRLVGDNTELSQLLSDIERELRALPTHEFGEESK